MLTTQVHQKVLVKIRDTSVETKIDQRTKKSNTKKRLLMWSTSLLNELLIYKSCSRSCIRLNHKHAESFVWLSHVSGWLWCSLWFHLECFAFCRVGSGDALWSVRTFGRRQVFRGIRPLAAAASCKCSCPEVGIRFFSFRISARPFQLALLKASACADHVRGGQKVTQLVENL